MSNNINTSNKAFNSNDYIGIELQRVIVGIENPTKREVLTDKTTGYNYSRNLVEPCELYDFAKKKHSCYFMLDLETGKNGWYPGCEIHGDISEDMLVDIKASPSETAETIEAGLSKTTVTILEITTIDQEPLTKGWYKVLYTKEGYIKKEFITNLRYADPNRI
jgi:hypothetical protein